MDVSKYLDKAYENKTAQELVDAPVDALAGISKADAELLAKAFNVKTIGDLATLKYFKWAEAIVTLSK